MMDNQSSILGPFNTGMLCTMYMMKGDKNMKHLKKKKVWVIFKQALKKFYKLQTSKYSSDGNNIIRNKNSKINFQDHGFVSLLFNDYHGSQK